MKYLIFCIIFKVKFIYKCQIRMNMRVMSNAPDIVNFCWEMCPMYHRNFKFRYASLESIMLSVHELVVSQVAAWDMSVGKASLDLFFFFFFLVQKTKCYSTSSEATHTNIWSSTWVRYRLSYIVNFLDFLEWLVYFSKILTWVSSIQLFY